MDVLGKHARVAIGRRHAGEPGGDVAIVVSARDDGVFCFLADVTGNGARASRFARELEELVRALAPDIAPGALLVEVNARLAVAWIPGVFASAACLWLDAARGWGTIAIAGHIPPVVRATRTRPLAICAGPMLGVFDGQTYSEAAFELDDGEVLVLVTDGVSDPLATSFDALGLGALLAVVDRAPPDLTGLCAELLEHASRGAAQDDATVIAIARSTWHVGHPLCSLSER